MSFQHCSSICELPEGWIDRWSNRSKPHYCHTHSPLHKYKIGIVGNATIGSSIFSLHQPQHSSSMASLTGAASRLLLAARTTGSTTSTRLYFSSSYVSPLKCPKSSPLLSHVFRYQVIQYFLPFSLCIFNCRVYLFGIPFIDFFLFL